ncbi:Transcription activator TEC1 [Candida viswanathii]|uniref:Transcription activator TEC1 n=1 Tax=Candida viswanathii TaxID=5486 RepID=A0A367XW67_9ASCO|nr:Transcription activator TEC1 [Candida viswanathii]
MRNSSSNQQQNKKLPLIVDVAIDTNGKQLYQVHESSKLVRKEMPRSTNFAINNEITDHDAGYFISQQQQLQQAAASNDDRVTPVRKVLGALSPSSLNQKRAHDDLPRHHHHHHHGDNDDDSDSDGHMHDDKHPGGMMSSNQHMYGNAGGENYNANDGANNYVHDLQHIPTGAYSRVQDNDIWSDDVEQAFEEVLRLIPKNGLNKIKIAGRSCGRNELISDYIFTKTGKYRTRKQVSSHIQVIKNLGQKLDIIQLINDGPMFANKEEQIQSAKKFEEVFSKINLNKSLGFSDSMKRKSPGDGSFAMHLPATKRIRRKNSGNPLNKIKFSNFFMSVNDQYSMNPVVLTIQQNNNDVKSLKLKDNANISNRFPGLNDFKNCSHIPIIHNMVKVLLPQLPATYNIDSGFSSSYALRYEQPGNITPTHASIISTENTYSSFTCIYSYGKEVLKFDEDGIRLNQDRDFLTRFWKFFFGTLVDKTETDINVAFKGITIKQIIYEASPNSVKQEDDSSKVCKLKVKLVLLWEFAKVDECKDALTTTTKIVLPPRILTSSTDVTQQVFEYSQPAINSIEASSSTYSSAPPSTMDLNNHNLSASSAVTSAYSAGFHSAPTSAASEGVPQQPVFKPQVKLQKKFQSLQHLQPHHMAQQQPQQGQQFAGRNGGYGTPQPITSSPYAQYSMPPPPPPPAQIYGSSYTHHSNMDLMMLSSVQAGQHNAAAVAAVNGGADAAAAGPEYQLGSSIGYSEGFAGEF